MIKDTLYNLCRYHFTHFINCNLSGLNIGYPGVKRLDQPTDIFQGFIVVISFRIGNSDIRIDYENVIHDPAECFGEKPKL